MGMIYFTGDTHGDTDIHKLNAKNFPIQAELTKDDFMVICGDFGLVWNNDSSDRFWRKWLEDKPFTTLFIDGNHENFDLLQKYPIEEWRGGKVQRIMPSVLHLMRGQVFEIDGKRIFTMGGATSHDQQFRREGFSWWPQELPSEDECNEAIKNLLAVDFKVDIAVTHCAPTSLQTIISPSYTPDSLTAFLDMINNRLEFKRWYIGHYHEDRSLGKYRLIYNDILEGNV